MKSVVCKKGDNVVMPDGRPLHAWENELEETRRKSKFLDLQEELVMDFFRLKRIVEIRREEIPETGNILITVMRDEAKLRRDYRERPEKYVEINGQRMRFSHRVAIDKLFRHSLDKSRNLGESFKAYCVENFIVYAMDHGWINADKIIMDLNPKRIDKILKF
jgi:hypothetical protein